MESTWTKVRLRYEIEKLYWLCSRRQRKCNKLLYTWLKRCINGCSINNIIHLVKNEKRLAITKFEYYKSFGFEDADYYEWLSDLITNRDFYIKANDIFERVVASNCTDNT